MIKKYFFQIIFFAQLVCFSSLFSESRIDLHFKKFPHDIEGSPINGIDFIYLVNLDERPERWERCLQSLSPFGIFPQRFSAVYGWTLSRDIFNDIGLVYRKEMERSFDYVQLLPADRNGNNIRCSLDEACDGKAVFSKWISRGAIGCTLSHLSVLQDAYDANYETVWIMEDDICLKADPRLLSKYIKKLDVITGEDGWDILFTDEGGTLFNSLSCIDSQIPMMWRPDLPFLHLQAPRISSVLDEDFRRIFHRERTHSIIYRKTGIEKILKFYKERGIFSPFDHELFLIADLKIYEIRKPIVTFEQGYSDTTYHYF